MIRHVWQLLLFLVFLASFNSCDFKLDGEDFTKIEPPSTEGLFLNLGTLTGETIALKEKTTFFYSVGTGGKDLIESKVLLNGNIVWTTTLLPTQFDLDPTHLNTGTYKLRVEFSVKSGSGSLADKLEAEQIIVWREFNLLVDHSIPDSPDDPSAIAITVIENKDNTIQIHWNNYPNFNFQYYELEREDYDEKGNYVSGFVFPNYTESNQTTAVDHTYLGGKSVYKLKLHAANQVYNAPAREYEHSYKPNISYEVKSSGEVTIKWNSLKSLMNNFYQYKLEIREIGGLANPVVFELNNVVDTSVTYIPANFYFGSMKNMKLSLIPEDNLYRIKEHKAQLKYGQEFPVFDPYNLRPRFYSADNNFYLLKNFRLHKTDINGKTLDSLEYIYSNLVINDNYSGIGRRNERNYLIDLHTMTEMQEVILPNQSEVIVFGLSDNNVLMVNTNTGNKVVTLEGQVLLSLGLSGSGYNCISPDGKYIFFGSKLYHHNGTQYEYTGGLMSHFITSIDFSAYGDTYVAIGYINKISKYDLESNTADFTSSTYHGPCNYDPVSKKLGCLSGNQFVILDKETFEVYKSITVGEGFFMLYNETLICSSGAQIKLSDIP